MVIPQPVHEYDVVIIGAGPVGLCLSLLLHREGVSVAIVERQQALYPLPRAVVIDHESNRILSSIGLREHLDAVLEHVIDRGGQDGKNFVWRDKDLKLIADLHWEKPTKSGFPFAMGFCQPELEGLLEQTVLSRKIPIFRGYALRHIQQSEDAVSTLYEKVQKGKGVKETEGPYCASSRETTSDTQLQMRSKYLVGCDGANSTVRRLMEIECTRLDFENDWLIMDLKLIDDYVPARVERVGAAQICDPERPTTCVFGGKGRKRLEFMRLPHETKEDLLEDEKAWELIKPWGFHQGNCVLERKVVYTFNARWASRFYKERVILAGDALHLMPPFIGQGLNSGFRDANALAWRIPLLLQGIAPPSTILASYQAERLEHIRKLTEHCILLGKVICELDPAKAAQIHADLRANPPGDGYDPPLGRTAGILCDQPEAGRLSLHRNIKAPQSDHAISFDSLYGNGWRLISVLDETPFGSLTKDSRDFFETTLEGKCINLSAEQDLGGEYKHWIESELGHDNVVLVRPDFYVFGYAHASRVDALVQDLKGLILGTQTGV